MPEYSFTIGDHCVIRHEITEQEKYGRVREVYPAGRYPGSALIEFHPRGSIRMLSNGTSPLGYFTLIRHTTERELRSTKANPILSQRQQDIEDWLTKRRQTDGVQHQHQDFGKANAPAGQDSAGPG